MDDWKDTTVKSFKKIWNENPVAVISAGALAVTAAAKLIDALSSARGRRAYAKQVNYRIRKGK